jgi:hypothetical protein
MKYAASFSSTIETFSDPSQFICVSLHDYLIKNKRFFRRDFLKADFKKRAT